MGNDLPKHSSRFSKIFKYNRNFPQFFHFLLLIVGMSIGFTLCFFVKSFNFDTKYFSIAPISITISASLASTTSPLPLPGHPAISSSTLAPNTNEPPIVADDVDDEDLFRRATFNPLSKDYPFNHVPKVAFMFLTKGKIPLAPLWEKFFQGVDKGLYSIYVHVDPYYNESSIPQDSVFQGRTIPSKPVEGVGVTRLDATRRLLANALLDITNQRFVLLSDACIPLFNFTTTYNYLVNTAATYIESYDEPGKNSRDRYNPKMFPAISISQWRKGSQWFVVNREFSLDIISDKTYYPLFQQHLPRPRLREEHYIPTFVNIVAPDRNLDRTITWEDWSKPDQRPAKFGAGAISKESINQVRFGSNCTYNGFTTSMCFMFAREFLPNSLQSLMNTLSL